MGTRERNWNQRLSKKFGSDFEMFNKACHVCGSFERFEEMIAIALYKNGDLLKPVWTNVQRVNKQNFSKLTHPSPKRNMVPRTVLTRTMEKFRTMSPETMVHQFPLKDLIILMHKGNPHQDLKNKGVIESGCSRHMTRNVPILRFDELMEDLLPLEEQKFNLFSVSQMCDKKNSVLFTDTECVVLSPDFKLTDENHVLLKVPRKDNMYSVDLKICYSSGRSPLVSLMAKATLDESNL
ncbi:hypothetical protein Tco_0903879 [Tanacetum coccineum]